MSETGEKKFYIKINEFKQKYDYTYLLHNCSDYNEEYFVEDAKWLKDHYVISLDKNLIDLLKKTVVFYSDSIEYYESAVPLCFSYSPNIHEALRTVDDKDLALHWFVNEDHNWMALYQEAYKHLTREGRFFLDQDELKEIVLRYLDFLENNRETILKTGFAKTKFSKNEWFDFFFTNTLPVKLPLNIYGDRVHHQHFYAEIHGSADRDEHGDVIYNYRWFSGDVFDWWRRYKYKIIKQVVDGEKKFSDSTGLFDWVNEEPLCAYEEAGYIPSLNEKDVDCAESLRERIFEWKLDILNTLLEYLYERKQQETFYSECLRNLSEKITSEELECLYGLDKKYNERKIGEYLAFFQKTYFAQPHIEDFSAKIIDRGYIESEYSKKCYNWNLSGGIEAIFGLIGFLQKELTICTYTRSRKELKQILPEIDVVNSYYRAIEIAGKEQVEKVLDGFLNRMWEEKNYWEYYRHKVKSQIERDFKKEVTISMRIKGKYIQSFYPVLESIAGTIEYEVNKYGNIQSVFGKIAQFNEGKEKPTGKYLFRKIGEGFEIAFNGKSSFFLKETVGLNYIYILITNRNKLIPIQDLLYNNKKAIEHTVNVDNYNDALIKGKSVSSKEYSYEDLKPVVTELKELIKKEKEANALGNYNKAEELRYKIEKLQDYIREAKNIKQDPELERIRTSVKNAINNAIKKIKNYDVDLARHFEEKISTGYTCIYTLSPSDNVDWAFRK